MKTAINRVLYLLKEIRLRVAAPVGAWYLASEKLIADLPHAWSEFVSAGGSRDTIPPIVLFHFEDGEFARCPVSLPAAVLDEIPPQMREGYFVPFLLLRDPDGTVLKPLAVGRWPKKEPKSGAVPFEEFPYARATAGKIADQWILRLERQMAEAPEQPVPAVRMPFGLQRCDVPQTLKRHGYAPVMIANPDYWKLMTALIAAWPNAISDSKLEQLFSCRSDRDNAPKKLRQIIDSLGLGIAKWTLMELNL